MASLLPILGGSSTKGCIIEILSAKWPLTAKKIYNQLVKGHHLPITYQAAHKALQELVKDKVLEKRKEGYLVSREWVKRLGDFTERIREDLDSLGKKQEVKTIHKLVFSTHREFIKFHMDFIQEVFKKDGMVDMLFFYRHVPYPHVLSNEEIQAVKQLGKKLRWTMIAKMDTPVGRWCAKQWRKFGVKVKLGADASADRLIIVNDYILNVYMSKEAITKWDKAYAVKSIDEYDANFMAEQGILNPKYKTFVTIMRDKEIASLLRSFSP